MGRWSDWGEPDPAYVGDALIDLHPPAGTPWRRTDAGSYYPVCCATHCPTALWAQEMELRGVSDSPAPRSRKRATPAVEAPSSCDPAKPVHEQLPGPETAPQEPDRELGLRGLLKLYRAALAARQEKP